MEIFGFRLNQLFCFLLLAWGGGGFDGLTIQFRGFRIKGCGVFDPNFWVAPMPFP